MNPFPGNWTLGCAPWADVHFVLLVTCFISKKQTNKQNININTFPGNWTFNLELCIFKIKTIKKP